MYDYGFRNYEPAIGRWMNIDPLAEEYYNISVYNYVDNNPTNNQDPDGQDIIYGSGSVTYTQERAVAAFRSILSSISSSNEGDDSKNKKGNAKKIFDGIVKGLDDLVKAVAPIRPMTKDDPQSFGEWWDGISNLPENISNVFENGDLEDKTRLITGSLGILKGKKPSVSNIIRAGIKGGGKLLYFGKLAVDRDVFHKKIKPKILKNSGNFSSAVGKNPDIKVVGDKIQLSGTGPFKGKSFNTNLKASEYLKQ